MAELRPRPDVPAGVRKLPTRPSSAGGAVASRETVRDAATPEPMPPPGPGSWVVCAGAPAAPPPRPSLQPLAPERYRIQFTVGREAYETLRRVQDLLRREIPDGDPGAIFERALGLLLEDVARKKVAATPAPRPPREATKGSRHIPAHVKRAVWIRDGDRCAFVARGGRRCGERALLEFHHRLPYALDGAPTAANTALRCRTHNAYEAEIDFGFRGPRARSETRTRIDTSRGGRMSLTAPARRNPTIAPRLVTAASDG